MAKNFKQLRTEWMGKEKSDNINYCMPVNIGVISQNITNPDQNKINTALKEIMKQLERWFGKFSSKSKTPSHNQLIVMIRQRDSLAGMIADELKKNYNAAVVIASEQDIKKYCWITIAAWDGMTGDNNEVYPSIKEILSTINTVEDDYQLRFPENRPVFQIVLPLPDGSSADIDYSIREIYPHMLETINKPNPWFCREQFKKQSWLDKWKDSKRRNFKANALRLKKFNKKIIQFSRKIDNQKDNVFDLLPWQHFEAKYKIINSQFAIEDHVNITNLREIFYDVVSMKAQKSEDRQSIILLTLAGIGLASFVMYSDSPFPRGLTLGFFWLFAASMLCAYLIYLFRVQIVGSHKTYLEFRALAEGMRVQCYWYAAGINQSVGTQYTVNFQKDMQWAKQAFNAWYVSDYLKYRFPSGYETVLDNSIPTQQEIVRDRMIKAEWLGTLKHQFTADGISADKATVLPDEIFTYDKLAGETKDRQYQEDLKSLKDALGKEMELQPGGQYGYFYKSTRNWDKENRKAKRRNIISLLIWILSAIALIALILVSSKYEDYFVCLMGICTIIPLVVSGWSSIKAYGELASKYAYCELLAEKALQDYQTVEKSAPEKIKKIFEKYGIEALEENAEWLMIKNDREPTVPNG